MTNNDKGIILRITTARNMRNNMLAYIPSYKAAPYLLNLLGEDHEMIEASLPKEWQELYSAAYALDISGGFQDFDEATWFIEEFFATMFTICEEYDPTDPVFNMFTFNLFAKIYAYMIPFMPDGKTPITD